MSDSELVERARRGDAAAFGELVERHRAAVYRTALAALGSAEEAEEVAQDAFVSAFQKLDGFRGEASFKTWLLSIAWRQAIDRRSSLAQRIRRFITTEGAGWPDPPASARSPEDALLNAELRGHVRRLVRTLPVKLRDALLLSASGAYGYEEIARMLGVPAGTVKWRVVEARRLLKRKLARLGYPHD